LLRQRSLASWLRLFLITVSVLSFATSKAIEMLFGFRSMLIVEVARFLGIALATLSYPLHNFKETFHKL
jgi:hypothetical protein